MEVMKVGKLTATPPPSRDEIRERAERRMTLIDDAQAFTRALDYPRHTRASKKRAGRELTWRDAEAALHGRVATCVEMYERAQRALAREVAA